MKKYLLPNIDIKDNYDFGVTFLKLNNQSKKDRLISLSKSFTFNLRLSLISIIMNKDKFNMQKRQ